MEKGKKAEKILVCCGTGCVSAGADKMLESFRKNLSKTGAEVKPTGCHGFCQQGPLVIIEPEGVLYARVEEGDVPEILSSHVENGKKVERLLYTDPVTKKTISHYSDIPFYKMQNRIILRNCGHIDPEDIAEYEYTGGYKAIRKVLEEMNPGEVIETIKKSSLRGLGGAGFPAGLKWEFCYRAEGDEKYIICNGDEGDPGSFQDRSVLEGDPHSLLEGMMIAGTSIGAGKGFIYVRAEYPLAVKRLNIAVNQARRKGYLGKNIFNSGRDFDIEIFLGAGAFVCGEETALIRSIEGQRGTPRHRPPFPAQSGLWGKPTLINNVKTYASVPNIINNGVEWFRSMGTEKSKGTAIFSLTGEVANCGLIEVPMGITLRKIIFDIGGGTTGNTKFKAAQIGGPSGGCLPEEMLDMPIDFDSLKEAGAMMGSGGLVVMNENTCMVDIARYFLEFTQKESCGDCTPCRLGTKQMLDILNDIVEGRAKPEDLDLLAVLAEGIKSASLCGLGQTAPNPVLTTLKYFRHEYEEHINNRLCRAKKCKALISYRIDAEKCTGCRLCFKNCPETAIDGEVKQPHFINQSICTRCGICIEKCPPKFDAIKTFAGVDGGEIIA